MKDEPKGAAKAEPQGEREWPEGRVRVDFRCGVVSLFFWADCKKKIDEIMSNHAFPCVVFPGMADNG